MNTPETFKFIPGYEDKYKISNKGKVFYLSRKDGWLPRKINYCTTYSSFSCAGKPQKVLYIHRIVSELFLGPKPEGMVIRHLDGNRRNNSCENLSYGTPEENTLDSIKNKTFKGSNNGRSKLDEKDIKVIKLLLKQSVSLSIIARAFEVTVSCINLIHKGKNWSFVNI